MNAATRLVLFGVAALASLLGGVALGAAVGPVDDADPVVVEPVTDHDGGGPSHGHPATGGG